MRYTGPIKLDFKRHPGTGDFYLLEGNTRFTLWNHLGAACGVNLPYIAWLDLLYGQSGLPSVEYLTGVKWLAFGNDLRAFARDYRPEGDLSWPRWLLSLRGRKVYNVFSWRDPWPFAVAASRYFRVQGRKIARIFQGRTAPASAAERDRDPLALSK
ncbi:MAG TPA: hypothetical protein VHP11_17540 [Tepidisphaeraceae bacterium]|nr:hypothetical protein [Tepidisphaeraceae bacterium]